MNTEFSSDKPILNKEQDLFQRYSFARRIAHTIASRDNDDGVVIGIYGAWGEGKTSILNFIDLELSEHADEILMIKFNPWRYSDEEALIKNFFKKIAILLDKELENRKEKFGSFVERYGSITGFLGADISSVGKAIADIGLEDLRDRINDFIVESEKKLVIIVDDIDRLDKHEIYTLFKLVKLTADFKRTTYILSFDEKMVSAALGERFGKGDDEAGFNFLEKIVQVPLKLPHIPREALRKFCLNQVENVVFGNELSLSQKQIERFVDEFNSKILIRLKTPRLALRYANSLSFAIPLLKGEVNHVDLLIIEAIKIFYPQYYEFIKKNPSYFLESYSQNHVSFPSTSNKDSKKERVKELLENLSPNLSRKEKQSIISLLKGLFPYLEGAYTNVVHHHKEKDWYKEKRIASSSYFDRYFIYTVLKGEVSDVEFDTFLSSLQSKSIRKIKEDISAFINESSDSAFLSKLRSIEDELEWKIAKKLLLSMAQIGHRLSQEGSFFSFNWNSPQNQSAIFIRQVLENHKECAERFSIANKLMKKPVSLSYSYLINTWLRRGKEEEKVFTYLEYVELAKTLRKRALKESGKLPIYVKFPDSALYLLATWKEEDLEDFNEYMFSQITSSIENTINLLWAFTPTMTSTVHPEPHKSNFSKESFDNLNGLIDVDLIHEMIIEYMDPNLLEESVLFLEHENNQTKINVVRQFLYHYSKRNDNND